MLLLVEDALSVVSATEFNATVMADAIAGVKNDEMIMMVRSFIIQPP